MAGSPVLAVQVFGYALLLVAVPAFIFGGGALMWVGARYFARKDPVSFWRCCWLHVASNLAGGFSAFLWALLCLALSGAGLLAGIMAMLIPAVFFVATFLSIRAGLDLPFGRGLLAWLPTLVPWLVVLSLAGYAAWLRGL